MRKRYENINQVKHAGSLSQLLRWTKERIIKKKDLCVQIPYAETNEMDKIQKNQSDCSISWIGHSSFLIQIGGKNILTDPVFARWMGVQKRITNPGYHIEELPEIDIVLISHGHYDHLEFPTLKKLKGNPVFYVPVGLGKLFKKKGFHSVKEASWWDFFEEEGLLIHFVPAQHWTKRTLFDTNTSHWGGWIVEDLQTERSIYFVGDTGYFSGFKEIKKRFTIDIVLMPIGAYEPEWFMHTAHINPENAVKAFTELKGNIFIPMHYGTYRLADDTGPEALERLHKEWNRLSLEQETLSVLKIGETKWF